MLASARCVRRQHVEIDSNRDDENHRPLRNGKSCVGEDACIVPLGSARGGLGTIGIVPYEMAKTAWRSCVTGVRQNDEKLTGNLGTTKKTIGNAYAVYR